MILVHLKGKETEEITVAKKLPGFFVPFLAQQHATGLACIQQCTENRIFVINGK